MNSLQFMQPIRCYNGAYDSASQRVIDAQKKCLAKIRERYPEATVTYFPMEGEFAVGEWGNFLSGFFDTKGEALEDACKRLGIGEQQWNS